MASRISSLSTVLRRPFSLLTPRGHIHRAGCLINQNSEILPNRNHSTVSISKIYCGRDNVKCSSVASSIWPCRLSSTHATPDQSSTPAQSDAVDTKEHVNEEQNSSILESEQVKSAQSSAATPTLDPPTQTAEESLKTGQGVYVGNLSFQVSEDQLQALFEPYGAVSQARIIRDFRGESRGFGFIEFENMKSVEQSIEGLNDTMFGGRRLLVSHNRGRQQNSSRRQLIKNPPSRNLFIGNLPFEMTDKDLHELFQPVVNVLQVRVAVDQRTGEPRGFAHADFADIQSATQALEFLEKQTVFGRRLRVDYATERRQTSTEERTSSPPASQS